MGNKLKLYGTDWCSKSTLLKNYLQSQWIEFEYYNVDLDDIAKEEVMSFYDGELKFPTVSIGDDFLKNPKIPELREFLKSKES